MGRPSSRERQLGGLAAHQAQHRLALARRRSSAGPAPAGPGCRPQWSPTGRRWPVDSVDGLRPPSLTTGPSTASRRSISFMLDFTVPVSPRTNGCPEKPGAAQALPFHAESVAYVSASTRLQRIELTPVTVHNLSFTTSLARSVAELNPEIIRFYDAVLREKFGGQKPARTRLYVSRANARYRRVENEPELIEELAKLHFTAVDPGAHTFDAQVAMFWNADVVVGAHGAGLTNLVFAPNCRFAFELLSSGFRDRSTYAHICRHRKIAYGATSWEPVLKGDVEDSD